MTAPIEFDGPANWHCLGHPYTILTCGGVKEQGRGFPGPERPTEEEAWAEFKPRLAAFTEGATQIAWRHRPSAIRDSDEGGWRIYSRLYCMKDD